MRFCPLISALLPCNPAMPLCGRCPAVKPAPPPPRKPTCIDCGAVLIPTGNHQRRCPPCGEKHNRVKNAAYQSGHRHRKKENHGNHTDE